MNLQNELPQLSLGEIISKIEKLGLTWEIGNKPKTICFDFGSAIPTNLDSWRGDYSHLALGYNLTGYDKTADSDINEITAENLLQELKSSIGKTFEGWKGGDYVAKQNTPVWVANPGNSGSTIVVDVICNSYELVIITQFCEY